MNTIVNGCNITLKLAANESTSNDYVYILPILVKGDDGKEYNVIPSDQFK